MNKQIKRNSEQKWHKYYKLRLGYTFNYIDATYEPLF